jgi:hypothetical protein
MNYLDYYCKTFGLTISGDLVIDVMCWAAVGKIVEDGKYVHFFGQLNPTKMSDLLLPALENFGVH